MNLPQDYDPGRDLVFHMGDVREPLYAQRTFIYKPAEGFEPPSDAPPMRIIGAAEEITGIILSEASVQPCYAVFPKPSLPHEEVIAFASLVDDTLRSKYLQNKTVERFGKTWILHVLENVGAIASMPAVCHLDDALKNRPAVIVSPGPSLAKQLPALREAQGRVCIVCGTHSLHVLKRAGIKPDITLIADPGDHARHFAGIEPEDMGLVGIAVTARPQEFELPLPRRFAFAGNGQIDSWISASVGENWAVSTGGSVACCCMSLAQRLGCNPIVFIGQDLSFESGGRYYSEGSLDEDVSVEQMDGGTWKMSHADGGMAMNLQRSVQIPGYYGGMVNTSQPLHAFWTWFEAISARDRNKFRFINSTEGGARIPSMEQMPFSEALSLAQEPFDTAEALAVEVDARARRGKMRAYLGKMTKAAPRVEHHVNRCLSLLSKLHAHRTQEVMTALQDTETELKKWVDALVVYPLYNHTEVLDIAEFARLHPGLDGALAAGYRSFMLVRRAVGFFRGPLQKAAEVLE